MRNSFKHIFGLDRNVGFQEFILVENNYKRQNLYYIKKPKIKRRYTKFYTEDVIETFSHEALL